MAERIIEMVARMGVATIWVVVLIFLFFYNEDRAYDFQELIYVPSWLPTLGPDDYWFSIETLKFVALVVCPAILIHTLWLWILGYEEIGAFFTQKEWFITILFISGGGLVVGFGAYLGYLAVRFVDQWFLGGLIYRTLFL